MPKPIFTASSTDYLVMEYGSERLDEPGFGDKLDTVLENFRYEVEDGQPVFDYIEQGDNQVVIKFARFVPMLNVNIWINRIEKAMKDICAEQNAA